MSSSKSIYIPALLCVLNFIYVKGVPINTYEVTINLNGTINYELFTRKNPIEFQLLRAGDVEGLRNSNYNPNAPVKLYAPGWDNNGSIAYPTRDEYLIHEDCNVIIINWKGVQPADGYNATDVIEITTKTGLRTSALIDFLIDNGTPRSAFHIIGHSAGTHLAGVASAGLSSGRVPRITGLDPAKPWNDTYNTLDVADADFVDIVHTNGGVDPDDRAIFKAMGHVDFYANGGEHQPGCEDNHCNHVRTAPLFAESINSEIGFKSLRCDTFEHFQQGLCDGNEVEFMGDPTPTSARGVFQFVTNGVSPFARE